jgi:hypothetical protein
MTIYGTYWLEMDAKIVRNGLNGLKSAFSEDPE